MRRGQPPHIHGDGSQTRDFTYVENVVHANLLAMRAAQPLRGVACNIGCGARISINALVAALNAALGTSIQPTYGPPRAGDVRDSLADISRARELLGYAPHVVLRGRHPPPGGRHTAAEPGTRHESHGKGDSMADICVLGLGYVGLPTASLMANAGFRVLGVDVDQRIVQALRSGETRLDEAGLATLVAAAVNSGKLQAASAPEPSDTFIICVPTPVTAQKTVDLAAVEAATRMIVPLPAPGQSGHPRIHFAHRDHAQHRRRHSARGAVRAWAGTCTSAIAPNACCPAIPWPN